MSFQNREEKHFMTQYAFDVMTQKVGKQAKKVDTTVQDRGALASNQEDHENYAFEQRDRDLVVDLGTLKLYREYLENVQLIQPSNSSTVTLGVSVDLQFPDATAPSSFLYLSAADYLVRGSGVISNLSTLGRAIEGQSRGFVTSTRVKITNISTGRF